MPRRTKPVAGAGRSSPRGARFRQLALVVVLAGTGLSAGWSGWRLWLDKEPSRALAWRRPHPVDLNVVLITLDTLRADRLGCHGHPAGATPHIDRLAAEGVVFEQATATVPLTLPSHCSIFTGLVPPHHGVRDNGGFFLDASRVTLAERLREAGYATGAFVGAWVLDSRWGLDQGFDRYDDHFDLSKYQVVSLGTVQKKGDAVVDGALDWLKAVRQRKFFAWVHLYDPHTPYEPPEPFASRHAGQPYLGEVAYTDHVVGRLLDWLRAEGLMERTLLVLTADHGESLGDHGESTHAYFVYDATMAVPLIVRTPWGDRGRSRTQASSVDLMPTVLELLGLPPATGVDGRSLARAVLSPQIELGHVAYSESYFPRYHFGWQHLRALRDGRYKLIEAPRPELYDVQEDPGETRNIYKAYSARAEELRLRLERLGGTGVQEAPSRQQMDPDTLQRLAALGYVGNMVDADPAAVLPDPKDKLPLFARMSAAKAAAQDDRLDEAIGAMTAVLGEDPKIVDAHVTLGNWLRRAGRAEDAASAFKAALALQPENELALSNLANLYRATGRQEAALEGYRAVLRLEPRNPQTWYHLATLLLDLGRVDEAEETFRQALRHNPTMGAGHNSLGAIAFARGRLDEAEQRIRKARDLEPELRTVRFNLARVLELKGDTAAAEALYREELRTYPDHGKARFNLAQILKERGDRTGYLRELRASLEKAPEFGPAYFFLAREELDGGKLAEAADLARRGLDVDSASEVAPLGYYVLADVYSRRGQPGRADAEVEKARRLEAALRRNPLPRI